MIPINRDLKREMWIRTIARDPTTVIYHESGSEPLEVLGRVSNVSYNKKASIAGLTEEIADLECMIALPTGSDDPQPFSDYVEIDSTDYRILEVMPMISMNCYILTLTYENE